MVFKWIFTGLQKLLKSFSVTTFFTSYINISYLWKTCTSFMMFIMSRRVFQSGDIEINSNYTKFLISPKLPFGPKMSDSDTYI